MFLHNLQYYTGTLQYSVQRTAQFTINMPVKYLLTYFPENSTARMRSWRFSKDKKSPQRELQFHSVIRCNFTAYLAVYKNK